MKTLCIVISSENRKDFQEQLNNELIAIESDPEQKLIDIKFSSNTQTFDAIIIYTC